MDASMNTSLDAILPILLVENELVLEGKKMEDDAADEQSDGISEVVYEELDMLTVASACNEILCTTMAPYGQIVGPNDVEEPSSDMVDEEPEYSSLSTNSEESGITSPIYRYEEELDSLSLCSSTSVVDDKDDEIIPTSSDYCPPVSLVLPQASVACVPEISLPTKLISRDAPNKSASLGSLRSTAEVTEKFKRHNIRSSIVKRLTISWKREYDFQLETDKSFAEEDTHIVEHCQLTGPVIAPPQLPPPRPDLKHDEVIRRHVLGSILDSENSYVDSLFKLVKEYQEPLKESVPPIISAAKIGAVFSKIPQILQIHMQLRTQLKKLMNEWKAEKLNDLGDIFVGLFSRTYVAEVYAAYVCNFAGAIETVKKLSKEKPAFADFLRVRQESSKDRLPLFGLLVKPVQRFPQFILLLQDLLKNTPSENLERISLQIALTHLESLADCLNERKREYEQEKAAKGVLKWAKIPVPRKNSIAGDIDEVIRRVVAEEDFKELELTPSGGVLRMKTRRLFLLNDLLIITVPRMEENDRPHPAWIVHVSDVQIVDQKPVKFLGYQVLNKRSPSSEGPKEESLVPDHLSKIYKEMADMRQDYEAVKRIHDLIGGLTYDYAELPTSRVRQLLNDIQATIQVKMEDVARSDDCTFQLIVSTGKARSQKMPIILQAPKRKDKLHWITLLHLSQLAYDKRKNPSWDDPNMKSISSPLFFLCRVLHLCSGLKKFLYKCGCYCFDSPKEEPLDKSTIKPPSKTDGLVYLCSSDGLSSRVSILSVSRVRNTTLSQQQQTTSIELLSFTLTQTEISCCEWIPGVFEVDLYESTKGSLAHDSVWFGTENGSVLVFAASAKVASLGSCSFAAPVRSIRFNFDKVYVALADCMLQVFKRSEDGAWNLRPFTSVQCAPSGTLHCTAELPSKIMCAVDNQIVVVSCVTDSVLSQNQPRKAAEFLIDKMVRCGVGLWVSYKSSSVISLFHIDTFKHLQDLNVAPNVNRVLAERNSDRSAKDIFVTSLLGIRGSLWIGTNVGLIINISLPKLDGVPINLSRPAVSFHSHSGPATLILALQPRSVTRKPPIPRQNFNDSDILNSFTKSFRFSTGNHLILRNWSDDSPDIYGLYDALMRGSSSSEEEIGSADQIRFSARRRHSLPLLPVDAEFHPPRPISFLRSSENSSLAMRHSSSHGNRPMSFSPTSEGSDFSTPIKQNLRELDSVERLMKRSESSKPRFTKIERDKMKGNFGTSWHSTLIVLSAGSGYRHWRGSSEYDKDDSSLCVMGWEMKV